MTAFLFLLQVLLLRSMRSSGDTVSHFLRQRRAKNPLKPFVASHVYRMQKWSLFLLCCLCLLSVRISDLKAEEATVEKCEEYFDEILETQKTRQMLQHGANELMRRYDRGNITKIELDNTLHVWYIVENELKEKVTALYDTAYEKKCFEEKLNESR